MHSERASAWPGTSPARAAPGSLRAARLAVIVGLMFVTSLTRARAIAAAEGGAGPDEAGLSSRTVAGWNRYIEAVERRRNGERVDGPSFLVLDGDADAASERRRLLSGAVVVREMDGPDGGGPDIEVPGAAVHHWRGAIFLPRTDLSALIASLATVPPPTGPDVLRALVLRRDADGMRLFLRLQRTKFVTVVYDTEHEVRFTRHRPDRASSVSVAVRIAEVADPGGPAERPLSAADDHGYLWRLNAYWRYQAVAGGVIAECESVSLSRSIPFGLRYLADPLVRSAARESMERTLDQLRARAMSDLK